MQFSMSALFAQRNGNNVIRHQRSNISYLWEALVFWTRWCITLNDNPQTNYCPLRKSNGISIKAMSMKKSSKFKKDSSIQNAYEIILMEKSFRKEKKNLLNETNYRICIVQNGTCIE